MTAAADPGMIAYGDFQSAWRARLVPPHRPSSGDDAVFAASDLMAAGALRALRRLGRRVPDDVAVIGFDDSPSQQARPKLTTVRQPVDAMAAPMVSEMLAQVADPRRRRRGRSSTPNSSFAIPPDPSNFHDFTVSFRVHDLA